MTACQRFEHTDPKMPVVSVIHVWLYFYCFHFCHRFVVAVRLSGVVGLGTVFWGLAGWWAWCVGLEFSIAVRIRV